LLACQKGSLQVAKPFSVLQEASAIPFAALTAWRALHGTAGISEGYVLLYSVFFRWYTPQFDSTDRKVPLLLFPIVWLTY
jgi:hypothetical protein